MESIIKPKVPTGDGWRIAHEWNPPRELVNLGYPVEAWIHEPSDLFALSAVEVAHDPGTPDLGPEYHLSVSNAGQARATSVEASFVLHAFGLDDATEDNHVPNGIVRNFWRPVNDSLSGYECACVDDEPAMREDNGDFVWRGVTK